MKKIKSTTRFLILIVVIAFSLIAQSPPTIGPAYTGAVMVSGKVAPGAGPVSIFDISYPVKTKLGDSKSVDAQGNFAVTVKPALIAGHQIIAVDVKGTKSAPVVIAQHQPSPTAAPAR